MTIPIACLHDAQLWSNRDQLLVDIRSHLPAHPVVAEVGVAFGGFTEVILKHLDPSHFDAFDTFDLHEQDNVFGYHPSAVLGDKTHVEYYRDRFPNVTLYRGKSWEALDLIRDQVYDFIYVDAGHDYDSVRRDIEQLKRVIKSTGVIMFDDYTTYDIIAREDFGVLRAVNEFITTYGLEVIGLSLHPEGFHNIAVRAHGALS